MTWYTGSAYEVPGIRESLDSALMGNALLIVSVGKPSRCTKPIVLRQGNDASDAASSAR